MQTVTDRPGHDRRYALTSAKVIAETGWSPQVQFGEGLSLTVRWYQSNAEWIKRVRSGEYQSFYADNYGGRAVLA